MHGFHYLEVTLQFEENKKYSVEKELFKDCILTGIESIFGEFATCIPIDIVEYDPWGGRGVLRCPDSFYQKFRAALTLTGEYQNRRCCFVVHRASKKSWLLPKSSEPTTNE